MNRPSSNMPSRSKKFLALYKPRLYNVFGGRYEGGGILTKLTSKAAYNYMACFNTTRAFVTVVILTNYTYVYIIIEYFVCIFITELRSVVTGQAVTPIRLEWKNPLEEKVTKIIDMITEGNCTTQTKTKREQRYVRIQFIYNMIRCNTRVAAQTEKKSA